MAKTLKQPEFIFSAPRSWGEGEYGAIKIIDCLEIEKADDGEPVRINRTYNHVGHLHWEAGAWEFMPPRGGTPGADFVWVMDTDLRSAKASLIRQIKEYGDG